MVARVHQPPASSILSTMEQASNSSGIRDVLLVARSCFTTSKMAVTPGLVACSIYQRSSSVKPAKTSMPPARSGHFSPITPSHKKWLEFLARAFWGRVFQMMSLIFCSRSGTEPCPKPKTHDETLPSLPTNRFQGTPLPPQALNKFLVSSIGSFKPYSTM